MPQIEGLNRVLNELRARESQLASDEERRRQAAENEAERRDAAIEDQGRSQASDMLRGLAGKYARRAEITRQIAPGLAHLYALEREIRTTEGAVIDILQRSRRFSNTPEVRDWYAQLRYKAELPEHNTTGLSMPRDEAELAAMTLIWSLLTGAVQPGFIHLGRVSVNMDIDI